MYLVIGDATSPFDMHRCGLDRARSLLFLNDQQQRPEGDIKSVLGVLTLKKENLLEKAWYTVEVCTQHPA